MASAQAKQEFYLRIGAQSGFVTVIAPTTASSETDLSTKEIWGGATPSIDQDVGVQFGRKIKMTATCDNPAQATNGGIYYAFDSVGGGTVSSTAAAGATQADFLAWGQSVVFQLPYRRAGTGATGQGLCKFLRAILAAAGATAPVNPALRLTIAEESPTHRG